MSTRTIERYDPPFQPPIRNHPGLVTFVAIEKEGYDEIRAIVDKGGISHCEFTNSFQLATQLAYRYREDRGIRYSEVKAWCDDAFQDARRIIADKRFNELRQMSVTFTKVGSEETVRVAIMESSPSERIRLAREQYPQYNDWTASTP